MSNEWKKGISLVMTALLVCGSVQIPVQAKGTEGRIRKNALTAVEKLNPEIKTAETELSDQDKKQLTKEETVYVIAHADGSPEKLIVSDWLKNAMGSDTLEDATELSDVTNVKGTEGFEQKQGSLGVWDAAGNDIYYQGSIQKELPVDLKVTYQLNGRTVSPEELAGQSGKVNIRFDYTNRQKEAVMVGENEEELYVPFVVMTSLVLDNENFRNIEVSNGKVINDGERTIVMGYAMPGLKDNLDIGSEDFDVEELDIPEYVELQADVTDFELATTLTVATNEIFGDMDIDTQEKMDDLSADMDELEDAMNELMDGTAELYDGVLELYDGTEELTDGIDELDEGAEKLNDGARELKDGTKELYDGVGTLKTGAGALFAGVKQLADGLKQLTQNDKALNDGAGAVYAGLLQMANGQINALNEALNGTGIQLTMLAQPKTPQEINNFLNTIKANQEKIQSMLSNEAMVRAMVEAKVGQMTAALPGAISIQSTENTEVISAQEAPKEESPKQEIQKDEAAAEPAEAPAPETKSCEEAKEEKPVQPVDTDAVTDAENNGKQEEPSGRETENADVPKQDPAAEADGTEEQPDKETASREEIEEPVSEAAPQDDDPEAAPQAEIQEKDVVMVQTARAAATPDQIIAGIKAQIVEQTYNQLMQTLQMTNGTLELLKGAYQMNVGIGSYTKGVDQVYAGVQELLKNAPALNSGIDTLSDGAGRLAAGASELKGGTRELKDGTEELRDGGQELRDGVEELRDGSEELKDGTIEFNEEGIQKLIDTFDGDLQELSDRFEGVKSAAKAYQSFAGISDGTEGNVRFIYKTAGIEK